MLNRKSRRRLKTTDAIDAAGKIEGALAPLSAASRQRVVAHLDPVLGAEVTRRALGGGAAEYLKAALDETARLNATGVPPANPLDLGSQIKTAFSLDAFRQSEARNDPTTWSNPHYRLTWPSEEVEDIYDETADWMAGADLSLKAVTMSQLHKVREAGRHGNLLMRDKVTEEEAELIDQFLYHSDAQVFLMQTDWAGAFKSVAADAFDNLQLPYQCCAFEFNIGGRHVIVVLRDIRGQLQPDLVAEVFFYRGAGDFWIASPVVDFDDRVGGPLHDALDAHIRALLLALDAELVTHEVERAPHRLNEERVRRGKLPIADHHKLTLRRSHALPRDEPSEPSGRRSPRLHFRRAHFRHYATFKTRIPATLVGNPDLGFIDKDYRL